jgi:hypothetical protein
VDCIARDFNFILLAKFISDDVTVEGTLLESVHTGGFSPSLVALNKTPPRVLHLTGRGHDGVADSLSTLLYHGQQQRIKGAPAGRADTSGFIMMKSQCFYILMFYINVLLLTFMKMVYGVVPVFYIAMSYSNLM